MAGKGSAPRPFSVDKETFERNWDKIFNKDKTEHPNCGTPECCNTCEPEETDKKIDDLHK